MRELGYQPSICSEGFDGSCPRVYDATPVSSSEPANVKFHHMRINSLQIRLGALAAILLAGSLQTVKAQTPSPLQEWQYSGGIILARLFEPDLPRFRTVLGLAFHHHYRPPALTCAYFTSVISEWRDEQWPWAVCD
jgi:hypothetical protein